MFGQLFLAAAFVVLGTSYFLGNSMNNKFAKTLPDEYKRTYLRKTAGLFYLCAIFIACMAFVERYEALTGAIYKFVYILGGCVLAHPCGVSTVCEFIGDTLHNTFDG